MPALRLRVGDDRELHRLVAGNVDYPVPNEIHGLNRVHRLQYVRADGLRRATATEQPGNAAEQITQEVRNPTEHVQNGVPCVRRAVQVLQDALRNSIERDLRRAGYTVQVF